MSKIRIGVAAAAVLLSAGIVSGSASAMPANGLTSAVPQAAGGVEKVAWVCGPYRCWWQPGGYWYRPGWGWHGGWGGWGWHGRRW